MMQLYTYSVSFSTMELGFRLAYLFLALIAMMVHDMDLIICSSFLLL